MLIGVVGMFDCCVIFNVELCVFDWMIVLCLFVLCDVVGLGWVLLLVEVMVWIVWFLVEDVEW